MALTPVHIPFILNVKAYRDNWILWWTACQPAWHIGDGWPFSREKVTEADWGKLTSWGQNGMFLVALSTAWWATSVKSVDEWKLFNEAVDNIRWVTECVLSLSSGPSTPNQPPMLPQVAKKCLPIASASVHPEGKHQPKPTCWVREVSS